MSLYDFFEMYVADKGRATYKKVPIAYLEMFKHMSKLYGFSYRIRYRGPRNTFADRKRSYANRASTCLKQNAVTFAAYIQR